MYKFSVIHVSNATYCISSNPAEALQVMGSSWPTPVVKDNSKVGEINNSSGFHILELHAPSIGTTLGSILIVVVIAVACCYCFQRTKKKIAKRLLPYVHNPLPTQQLAYHVPQSTIVPSAPPASAFPYAPSAPPASQFPALTYIPSAPKYPIPEGL